MRVVVIPLLSLIFSCFKLAIDMWFDSMYPWCDHPVTCFDFVTELAESVDRDVDPCHNLYDHVCGFWRSNHPKAVSQLSLLNERTYLQLLTILEDSASDQKTVLQKTLAAYHACRAVFTDEQNHFDFVAKVFKRFSFEWPSLDIDKNFALMNTFVGLSLEYNFESLFLLSLSPNLKTLDRYWFQLEFIIPNKQDQNDLRYVQDCIRAVRPKPKVRSHKLRDRIVATHDNILATLVPIYGNYKYVNNFNATFYSENITLKSLGNLTSPAVSETEWVTSINSYLPKDRQVQPDQGVLVMNSYLVLSFKTMMRSSNLTAADIMLYVGWKIVRSLAHAASKELGLSCSKSRFGEGESELNSALNCVRLLNVIVPYALGRLLFNDILPPASTNITDKLLLDIRETTTQSFQSVSWMDTKTRTGAQARVTSLVQVVGMPHHLLRDQDMEDWYNHVPIFRVPFIEGYLETVHKKQDKLKRILQPDSKVVVRKEDLEWNVVQVNAVYLAVPHLVFIPGAILQPPLVGPSLPKTVVYGSIGKVVAHELSHAFDYRLTRLTGTGEVVDWMTPYSREIFKSRLICLAKQISSISGRPTLGLNSISEAFADNAGSEKAYLTYSKLPKGSDTFGYTQDQLFFVSGCFPFCYGRGYHYSVDERYPPPYLRCNTPAMNAPQFAEAFKCKEKAPLNPSSRCIFH